MEGHMVDEALKTVMSLPEVIGEVSSKQKDQAIEIKRQQQILEQIKTDISSANERKNKLIQNIASLKRQTLLNEAAAQMKQQICFDRETEISKLTLECQQLRCKKIFHQTEFESEHCQYEECYSKMAKHRSLVEELRSTSPYHMDLKIKKEKLEKLKLEKKEIQKDLKHAEWILSGKAVEDIQSEYNEFENEIWKKTKSINDVKEKLNYQKNHMKELQQSVKVLHKRNNAQMTRLRKQLKDADAKNQQWKEQCNYFQKCILDAKYQLKM